MAKDQFNPKKIEALWEAGTRETSTLRQEYRWVDLFLRGLQWIYVDPHNGRIENFFPNDDQRRARPVMNAMGPSFENLMHRTLQRSLAFEVIPTGADDSSVQGAKIAESAVRHLHYTQNWEDKKEQLARAVKKGGIAAISIDWDAEAGAKLEDEDEDGSPTYAGEGVLTVHNITEFIVEPGSRDAETARWWMKAQILPTKTVQARYNLSKEPKKTEGIGPYGATMSGARGVGSNPEGTLVLTYYERPNSLCPEGRVATLIYGDDDFVFGPKPWPFPFTDRLNLVVGKDVVQEGHWYATSLYAQAIPIQQALNACWAAVIEHNAAIGNARMIVPSSNMQILEQLTDDPSHPVVVNANEEKPGYMTPPPLPQGIVQEIEMLQQRLDDLLAVHDISKGGGSGRVESGVGISMLIEQDNSPVGHAVKMLASTFQRASSLLLQLYETNTDVSREALVFVPGQPAASMRWSGDDLAGQTNVTVPVDKMLPRSKAASQQLAQTLVQMRMIPEGDIATFARIAEIGGSDDILWKTPGAGAVARAEWDVHALAAGVPVEPSEGYNTPEDFDLAIGVIRTFQLSPKYDRLDEDTKDLIRLYIKACETMRTARVAEMQRRASMNAQLAPGGMPLPPPPPQELIQPNIEQPPGGSNATGSTGS